MQPLLSIVIPIYNNERTLKKMVDSILIQKFDDWELLLVDDGSTDSCSQIIDDYAKSDNRIKAFHKQNGGTYSGFNFGLEKANGKYIIFACADDTFDATTFETIAIQAYEYNYDIIFIQYAVYLCDNEQNIVGTEFLPSSNNIPLKLTNKKSVEENWIYLHLLRVMYSPINAYKASLIKKYRFIEDIYAADLFMNVAIADEIQSVSYNPKILYKRYIYIYIVDKDVNVSSAKYYPYTHDMYNKLYVESKNLLVKLQNINKEEYHHLISSNRMHRLMNELQVIFAVNNKNTPSENIDIIMSYYDDIILETAIFTENLPNVDSWTFNAIGNIIQLNELPTDFNNPIVKMFTALNNTTISFDEIKSEITHSLLDYQNPYRIGFEIYTNLSAKHEQIANANLIEYLKTERTARKQLFTDNFEQALDTTIQLFNSKISTPEQYVILALCGYHLGLTEDAKNAVETGIKLFPNYPRLEELQNIINTERNE
ncbi:MAG: glycosyltransferase [Firmicutes bacterium]|nr:glycosyltransferase [Bacillota bacterium]